MRILHTYYETYATSLTQWLVLGGLAVFFVFIMAAALMDDGSIGGKIAMVISILGLVGFGVGLAALIVADNPPFAETTARYECVIDDDTNVNELLSKYNVVTTKGDIVVLEDKGVQE